MDGRDGSSKQVGGPERSSAATGPPIRGIPDVAAAERRGDVASLERALGSPRVAEGREAVYALERLGTPEAAQALVVALKDAYHASVRTQAAAALGEVGGDEALPPLVEALNDGDWGVRAAAVRALGELGRLEAADAVAELAYREPDDSPARPAIEYAEVRLGLADPPTYPIRKGIGLRLLGMVLFAAGGLTVILGLLPHLAPSAATWSANFAIVGGFVVAAVGYAVGELVAGRYLPPEGINAYLAQHPDHGGLGFAAFFGGDGGGGGGGDGGGGGGG